MRLRLSVALSVVMVGAALAAALHSHAAAGLPAVAELNLKIREWDIPSRWSASWPVLIPQPVNSGNIL